MKVIIILISLVLFVGCTSEVVKREAQIEINPKPIIDSIKSNISIQTSTPCDSLIKMAVESIGNYKEEWTTKEGAKIRIESKVTQDSLKGVIDSLGQRKYSRQTAINAQPQIIKEVVSFEISRRKLFTWWERIKLAWALPGWILFFGTLLILIVAIKTNWNKK